MRLSTKLLDLMIDNRLGPVIVGPFGGKRPETSIQTIVTRYNERHDVEIKIRQRQVIVVDPRSATSERQWQVEIIETATVPKSHPKKTGRPKDDYGSKYLREVRKFTE